MKKPVPKREQRQQLLHELTVARYWKEVAEQYGDSYSVKEHSTREQAITLELKLLQVRR